VYNYKEASYTLPPTPSFMPVSQRGKNLTASTISKCL